MGNFISQLDDYALTTLVKANKELELESDGGDTDNHIEGIINQASDIIESALNRKLKARLYVKERYDGKKQVTLFLNQYPVIAVELDDLVWSASAKTVTRNDGGSFIDDGFVAGDKVLVQNSNENSGLLTINFATINRTDIAFVDGAGGEDTITTVAGDFVAAGFVTGDIITVSGSTSNDGTYTLTNVAAQTLTMATGSLVISEDAGDNVTIAVDGVAALTLTFDDTIVTDSDDDDVTISNFRGLWVNEEEIDGDYYIVDLDNIYYLSGFSEGHKNIRITYKAGYTTIPDDIEEYCLRLVKKIYDKDRDVKSESLGPHSITYLDDGNVIEDVRKELSTYINWSV